MARVIIGVLVVAVVSAGSASAEPTAKPDLAVVDRTPVVVRGTGFGKRERVLVTLSTGVLRASQRTVATYRGAFVARFDGVRLPCAGATLVATGARGNVARTKLSLRECPGPALDS